ncbi:MAG: hypothetical protein ACOCUS_01730 [Polyangiales bacterium]
MVERGTGKGGVLQSFLEWLRERRGALGSAVLASGSLAIGACGDDGGPGPDMPPRDSGPLELTDARFLDSQRVQLTFTREILPVDEVDPEKFRLSYAAVGQTSSDYSYLVYFDFAYVGCVLADALYYTDSVSYEEAEELYGLCYDEYEHEYMNPVQVLTIPPGPGNQVVLSLDRPIPSVVLEAACSDEGRMAVCAEQFRVDACDVMPLVHFNGSGTPTVQTDDGALLDGLGEGWPDYDDYYGYGDEGDVAALDPTREIRCP